MFFGKFHPHLPYSKQPVKAFYIFYQICSALFLVPIWLLFYIKVSNRPRKSWSISQSITVKFLRKMHKMSEVSNVSFHIRDPHVEGKSGKYTDFKFIPTLERKKMKGVLDIDNLNCHPLIGTYVWPKHRANLKYNEGRDVESDNKRKLVGIYVHGGAYAHMSAHEDCQTSIIPKKLMKNGSFLEVHSVEYRLVHYATFPGALLDVASVYDNLINSEGKNVPPNRVIIIGDSAGANLVLSLARWIRDERLKDTPGGLILLSPWCNPSFSYPFNPKNKPRPNGDSDYLMDSPIPRALIIESFIGCDSGDGKGCIHCKNDNTPAFILHSTFRGRKQGSNQHSSSIIPNHISVHSPYISPSSDKLENVKNLFENFPKTFITYGTAERLVDEIETLIKRMKRNNVDLHVHIAEDAVHDVLILKNWDEKIRNKIWIDLYEWCEKL